MMKRMMGLLALYVVGFCPSRTPACGVALFAAAVAVAMAVATVESTEAVVVVAIAFVL